MLVSFTTPPILEGRKEMLYLTTDSTHLIYGYMVSDHSDSERGNPLQPNGLLFPISSKGSFICIIPPDRITHTTAFVTPVMEHWLEQATHVDADIYKLVLTDSTHKLTTDWPVSIFTINRYTYKGLRYMCNILASHCILTI